MAGTLSRSNKIGRSAVEVSPLGVGGGPFGNLFSKVEDSDVDAVIRNAAAAGVAFFDTSPFYGFGLSERRMGDALRNLPRDSFALSTKVGRLLYPLAGGVSQRAPSAFDSPMPFDFVFDYSYDGIMRSYEASLHRLGLGRIDILLIHDLSRDMHAPDEYARHFKIAMESGLKAASELRSSGDIKAIGLGVNTVEPCLESLQYGDMDVFLLASRYTLLEQSNTDVLFDECVKRDISIIAGAPFNSGILVTGSRVTTTYDHAPATGAVLERVAALEDICRSHGVALPAAALQFPLRHKAVAVVLPGLRNGKELSSALSWFGAEISEAFWDELAANNALAEIS
ncbi:aldo/keto reductase [Mesorhizobium sp. AR10]|uniref:aldo/keto reductase n=1 Tax=Mesorhizobium sp. AR10 TaxID=2865839 RepID=UPI0021607B24|nr:aldo/keto reductase [Mesorhizobium sp. AR10]UVK38867.1 aldo/keto reductase [Mesorhizobium sp. AR10]